MLSRWLPFEEPLVELEGQIDALKELATKEKIDLSAKINGLEARKRKLMEDIFSNLSPWDKVQMARHPKRPYTLDFVDRLCSDWLELHGDRAFGDDGAMVAGLARFRGRGVAVERVVHAGGRCGRGGEGRVDGLAAVDAVAVRAGGPGPVRVDDRGREDRGQCGLRRVHDGPLGGARLGRRHLVGALNFSCPGWLA